MAIVKRKRADGTVIYNVSLDDGRIWEKVGPVKREAVAREKQLKRELASGEYQVTGKARTVLQGLQSWSATRANKHHAEDWRALELHILPRKWFVDMKLSEVRPLHVAKLLTQLRTEPGPKGRPISDKYIGDLFSSISVMFKWAIRQELCQANPVNLQRDELNRRPQKKQEIYQPSEIRVLTRHHAVPQSIQVLWALLFFTGCREGEACGRRWRDLDIAVKPRPSLHVHDQYDGKTLKTARKGDSHARFVPLHDELVQILQAWAREGWELYVGRKPGPDDFIVPNFSSRSKRPHHTRASAYKALMRSAEAAGVKFLGVHATRHTFTTLCRHGGAEKGWLEKITHNAKGDMVDRYTQSVWEPLCTVIDCLNLDVRRDLPPTGGNPEELAAWGIDSSAPNSPKLLITADSLHGSIPGASTESEEKGSGLSGARQDSRQESWGSLGEFLADNRRRKRRLLDLQKVDPAAAKLGLGLTKGLDLALRVGARKLSAESLADHLEKMAAEAGAA